MYKVMLVEDEEKNRKLLEILIMEMNLGFEVVAEAGNGMSALETLKNEDIDVIFTDIRMPLMDGLEFAEKALSFNEKYKIIFISAYDEFDYAKKAIQLGAKGFLLKPFQRAELHDVLGKILKELDSEKENTFVQKEGKLVQQVVEYLERNYSDSTLSLSNTAEKFHINSSYLSRIFKKEYGINFIEFLTWYRIQKAVIYVKNTQMKAYEIAEKVGFTDTKYFGKCFKKLEGISIQEYRRKQ